MNGQLSEHPLCELIRELCAKGLSGSLRVNHEHGKVVVYFEAGQVIYAASNVRSLRLVEYLKRHKLVKETELARFADKRSDLALAAALAAVDIIRREDVETLVRTLTSDALRLALLWTEGSWHFHDGARLNDSIRLDLDTEQLMLDCARRIGVDLISGRFRNPNELISLGTRSLENGNLLPKEGFLLSRVEGEIRISDLVVLSGLGEPDALRTIYGLALAGFLQRESWQNAFRSGPRPNVIKPPPTPTEVIPPAEPQRSEQDELQDFLARMDAAESYYEVLGVDSATSAENIKEAYYSVARKYHPDKFRGKADTSLHARIESAFARITQAYETLMNASRRTGYDAKLAATEKARQFAHSAPQATTSTTSAPAEKPEGPDVPKEGETELAEDNFREGFAALQQGQINVAIGLLAAAARAVPTEPRYRAYYGRALATNEKTRRSAEIELQAAIRLESGNAGYHLMLAELYRDLGFGKRARTEAERALAIEPGNAGTRKLLRSLK